MTKNADPYLLYLIDVGRNWATFAIFTHLADKMIDNHDMRCPSLLDVQKMKNAMQSLDRNPVPITTWRKFFTWLGRGHGWATFSQKSAQEIVPHWLSDEAECGYDFLEIADFPPFAFIEPTLTMDKCLSDTVAKSCKKSVGPSPDPDASRWFAQIMSNMVISRRPLFAQISDT